MLAGSFAPVESVAKKLLVLSVAGLMAREKVIFGRYVVPTSLESASGVYAEIASGMALTRLTLIVDAVLLPAASTAVSFNACGPAVSLDKSNPWSNAPVDALNASGIEMPLSKL